MARSRMEDFNLQNKRIVACKIPTNSFLMSAFCSCPIKASAANPQNVQPPCASKPKYWKKQRERGLDIKSEQAMTDLIVMKKTIENMKLFYCPVFPLTLVTNVQASQNLQLHPENLRILRIFKSIVSHSDLLSYTYISLTVITW